MGENGLERDGIAALAPLVAEAAEAGDPAAIAIHDLAAAELADMAEALRAQLGFASDEPVPLSWSGGVLTNDPSIRGQAGGAAAIAWALSVRRAPAFARLRRRALRAAPGTPGGQLKAIGGPAMKSKIAGLSLAHLPPAPAARMD